MISAAVSIERRGRAFSSIYSGQLGGMAVGPLIGSLIGVSSMSIIFLVAGVMSVLACIPVLADADLAQHGARPEDRTARLRRRLSFNRAMTGSLLAAAALGLTIGVYESTWTLLLEHRQAATWQIGLSWTLFAIPFVAFSRVGGRLADRYDRRWLVFGALIVSVGFCCLYPFVTSVWWLLLLAPIESSGFAIALPSAQSLLTQSAAPGRRAASRDSSPRPRQRPSPWRRQPAARCSGSTSGRPMCSGGSRCPAHRLRAVRVATGRGAGIECREPRRTGPSAPTRHRHRPPGTLSRALGQRGHHQPPAVDREQHAALSVKRAASKPASPSHWRHFGDGREADEMRAPPPHPVAVHHPGGLDAPGLGVELGPVDHHVVTALGHRCIGVGREVADEPVVVQRLDEQPAPGRSTRWNSARTRRLSSSSK